MYGYHRAIQITYQASLPVLLGRSRPQFTANYLGRDLYALYASKNRLCMLCENTTPELTAYNAYRNANRRVRRAEGMKMYAVGDAYRAHTECIQAYKKSKREKFLFHFFFILPVLLSSTARDFRHSFLLFASSGIHGPHSSSLPALLGWPDACAFRVTHIDACRPYRTCDAYGKTDIVRGKE